MINKSYFNKFSCGTYYQTAMYYSCKVFFTAIVGLILKLDVMI